MVEVWGRNPVYFFIGFFWLGGGKTVIVVERGWRGCFFFWGTFGKGLCAFLCAWASFSFFGGNGLFVFDALGLWVWGNIYLGV